MKHMFSVDFADDSSFCFAVEIDLMSAVTRQVQLVSYILQREGETLL